MTSCANKKCSSCAQWFYVRTETKIAGWGLTTCCRFSWFNRPRHLHASVTDVQQARRRKNRGHAHILWLCFDAVLIGSWGFRRDSLHTDVSPACCASPCCRVVPVGSQYDTTHGEPQHTGTHMRQSSCDAMQCNAWRFLVVWCWILCLFQVVALIILWLLRRINSRNSNYLLLLVFLSYIMNSYGRQSLEGATLGKTIYPWIFKYCSYMFHKEIFHSR